MIRSGGSIFGKSGREDIDDFSSVKVFEKVKDGLEGAVGELVLLVRPEITSRYCGWDEVIDYTSQTSSMGFLMSDPEGKDMGVDGLLSKIILPTNKYIQNFSDSKSDLMYFNCMNVDDVGISDSDLLDTKIAIYVGFHAIENSVGWGRAEGYYKSMNHLGGKVSDEFYSENEVILEAKKAEFLDKLKCNIIKGLASKAALTKGNWGDLYNSALGWGVQDEILRLDDRISLPIGKYLEGKL